MEGGIYVFCPAVPPEQKTQSSTEGWREYKIITLLI